MGSELVKKNRIRIKNILDELMPKISGKIVIKKDADFDVICFDIDIRGYYPTRVCLWPQNHRTWPPATSELSPGVSSVDSGFDSQ